MYYHPHTHLEISRARQEDLVREADKRQLARLVAEERPGLTARIRAFLGERSAKRQPVVRPA